MIYYSCFIDYSNNTNYLFSRNDMKKNIGTNLGNLLSTAPTKAQDTTVQEPATEKVKGNYKTVSYSIPPATAEKIRIIADWDRRKLNAVVTEAFEQYAANWKPKADGQPPKF